jgi:hypothetical protein
MLCNRQLHYRVHDISLLPCILSQINPTYSLPPCLFKVHFNIIMALFRRGLHRGAQKRHKIIKHEGKVLPMLSEATRQEEQQQYSSTHS